MVGNHKGSHDARSSSSKGQPQSVASLKRAFAEQAVKATGGVVRYHFVPAKARWEEGLALLEYGAVDAQACEAWKWKSIRALQPFDALEASRLAAERATDEGFARNVWRDMP